MSALAVYPGLDGCVEAQWRSRSGRLESQIALWASRLRGVLDAMKDVRREPAPTP